jgi:hypothetical protein
MFKHILSMATAGLHKLLHVFSNQFISSLTALVVVAPFAAWIGGWFTGPSSYKIYFVGDSKQAGVLESWRGIKSSLSDEQIDDIRVETIQVDAAPDDAEEVSKTIVGKDDTLLVIGHFSSTASSHALNHYMLADPPIPVILPIESNPALDVRDSSRAYAPLFRLVPTDDLQAEEAANFAEETGAKRIWVIEDTETNPIYTQYVAAQFIRLIQDKYDEKSYLVDYCEERGNLANDCDTVRKWASDHYHARVVLRTTLLAPPSREVVKSLNIDFVFFVGQEENCLLIANELGDFFKETDKKPTLLAAKGCEKRLDKLSNAKIERTYTINHVSASDFYDRGYAGRPGKEAGLILKDIFDRVRQSRSSLSEVFDKGFFSAVRFIFKWHRAPDVRLALASEMERSIEKTTFSIDSGASEKYDLRFKKNGQVMGKKFFVWRLEKSGDELKFVDLKKTPDGKKAVGSKNADDERKADLQKTGRRTRVSQN